MEHISDEKRDVIRNLHLGGRGLVFVVHAPQITGGCHPVEFLRGVLPEETREQAVARIEPDILQHIAAECGRSCTCNDGKPVIWNRRFGHSF